MQGRGHIVAASRTACVCVCMRVLHTYEYVTTYVALCIYGDVIEFTLNSVPLPKLLHSPTFLLHLHYISNYEAGSLEIGRPIAWPETFFFTCKEIGYNGVGICS